ncbi:hypothetical protein [Herbaspirillum huttiense]|uniref:Uncharacterized protein n=1 Tax=Herbaspirillum huttiense subsp. lycopersici TaxID=3074428 RepID=A0ABU2EG62_9BURK|nr:hypothetical protein [Herbaspirillum huttiense]MDR9847125.1 hypothetical protein [Herbaspirillum huttiense SE1]
MTEVVSPGCFGAPSVFGSDSVVCNACTMFDKCADASAQRLQKIRPLIDVGDLIARHKAARAAAVAARRQRTAPAGEPSAQPAPITEPVERKTTKEKVTFVISEADQAVLAKLGSKSAKAHSQAVILCKNDKVNECRAMLPRGQNPFAENGPNFLRVACDMLINGGFTKAQLKAELMNKLGWTDGTAASHVAIAAGLFLAFSLIADREGAFVLNPALVRDNG